MSEVFSMYHPALQALGYSIFHSLWQSAVLFFPVQVLLFFCTKSATRYRILFSAFSLLFISFLITFFIEWQEIVTMKKYLPAGSGGLLRENATTADYFSDPLHSTPWWQQLIFFHQSPFFRKILPFISISYTFGILLLGARMLLMMFNIKKIKRHLIPVSEDLRDRFAALAALVPVKEKVQLFFSERINIPVMLGYFRPVVILPVALVNQLDWQQTEAILLHELAHVRRRDYLFNILQSIMEIFMFFNPLVWWFSTAIRKEREHACDDIAVQHTRQPVKYAEALLQLEYARSGNVSPAMAATGNNKKYSLLTRIKRIVDMKTPAPRSTQSIFASATIVMVIAAIVCFYAATAQEKDKDKKEPATKTQTSSYSSEKTTVIVKDEDGKVHTYKSESDKGEMPQDVDKIVKNAMQAADSALANVNWDEIASNISRELENVDWDEIGRSIKEAGEQVDWKEISRSISDATKDIDWDEIRQDINSAKAEINSKELKKALEDVKRVLEKAEDKSGKSGFNRDKINNEELKQSLEDVKRVLEKAEEGYGKSGFKYDIIRERARQEKDAIKAASEMYQQSIAEMKAKRQEAIAAAKKMREEVLDKTVKQREENRQIALKMRKEIQAQTVKQREESRQMALKMRADMKKSLELAKAEREFGALKIVDNNGVKIGALLKHLEKDGLIDQQKDFEISYKNDRLRVNGKDVPSSAYKSHFENSKERETTISGGKHKLSVIQK